MQGHAAVDDEVFGGAVHVEVHLLVHQTEGDGLVADEGLVVRFGVGHGLDVGQAVGHHGPHLPDVPLLVGDIFQQLDPEVGNGHAEAVVEADSAVVEGDAHPGHAAHVLGDGDGRRAELVDESVGEREVGDGILVDALVEEAFAGVERDVAVVVVDHRRHAVEAEAVEMELVEPVLDVRQQEVLHLLLSVVEEFRIPVGLVSGLAGLRVEVVGSVEFVDPLVEVLDVVRMHEVHDDGQPEFVGASDQLFELLGGPAARRGCEETRHVVSERPVVGVLGDGHELHGVVSVALDDREDLLGEFAVGADALALLGHADVCLVDQQAPVLRGVEVVAPPVERLGGLPELRGVVFGRVVLDHAAGVGRDAVHPAVVAVDVDLVEGSVCEAVAVHGRGEEGAPDASGIAVHPDFGALPVVEVSEDVDVLRPGEPFAQPPSVERLVPLPTEIAVSVGVVDDRPGRALDSLHFSRVAFVSAVHLLLDGSEPLVPFDDRESFIIRILHDSDFLMKRVKSGPSAAKKRIVREFCRGVSDLIQIYEKFFYLCRRTKKTVY